MTKLNIGALGFLFLFSTQAMTAETTVRICGGVAAIENVFMKIKEPFEKAMKIKLEIKDTGSDEALLLLENGQCDLATTGVNLEEIVEILKQKQKNLKDTKKFIPNLVGRDRRLVLINAAAKVKSLNNEQLKSIATGKIKSWKELGGPNLPVVTVFITKSPGLFVYWKKNVMGGAEWEKKNSKEVASIQDAKQLIAETPGAWTVVPASTKVESDKLFLPEVPDYGTPIYAFSYERPSEQIRKIYDFIRAEGSKYIQK